MHVRFKWRFVRTIFFVKEDVLVRYRCFETSLLQQSKSMKCIQMVPISCSNSLWHRKTLWSASYCLPSVIMWTRDAWFKVLQRWGFKRCSEAEQDAGDERVTGVIGDQTSSALTCSTIKIRSLEDLAGTQGGEVHVYKSRSTGTCQAGIVREWNMSVYDRNAECTLCAEVGFAEQSIILTSLPKPCWWFFAVKTGRFFAVGIILFAI